MRRFVLPIAFSLILIAACQTAGPLDPSPAMTAVGSTSVESPDDGILIGSGTWSTQNDSTPVPQESTSTEAAAGGIMMGSGT